MLTEKTLKSAAIARHLEKLGRETSENRDKIRLLEGLDRAELERLGVELLRKTVFVSSSQSMCGNCGGSVLPQWEAECSHCGTTWTHITASFFASGYTEDDYRATCAEMAPELKYVSDLGSSEPSKGWLNQPLRIRER